MKVYFPDTNFFFECRKAIDLPWYELEGVKSDQGSDVRLIVPPTVITEIERHKSKGNSRTAKRARDASALLRQAFTTPPEHITEIRAASPRITLELPPTFKVDFSQLTNLDPTRPDHRIVAEYVELLKTVPDLVMLTDDTLLALAVRSVGHEPLLIPGSWKLDHEKDERDDEIDQLKTELKGYKQASPDVSAIILNSVEQQVEKLDVKIEIYNPTEAEISEALELIKNRFPIESNFSVTHSSLDKLKDLSSGQIWHPPSEEEIEEYKNKTYPAWVNSVSKDLSNLATNMNRISCDIPFYIRIENSGFANADNVRLTITAHDGIYLNNSLEEGADIARRKSLQLTPPPKAPKGRHTFMAPTLGNLWSGAHNLAGMELLKPPPSRDPNGFYYVGGRPISAEKTLELTCEALPHQVDPYILGFRIVVLQETIEGKPRVRIQLRASNMKKPIDKFLPLSISFIEGDFIQLVNEVLNKKDNPSE